MNGLGIVAAAVVVAIAASELALSGTKLQTGLPRVVAVWGGIYILAVLILLQTTRVGVVAFTIFWAGVYLSWFGVRSHIESSILMRMMYLLRQRPRSRELLVQEYEIHYGRVMRLQELYRGGLAVELPEGIQVTPKGRMILNIVSRLR